MIARDWLLPNLYLWPSCSLRFLISNIYLLAQHFTWMFNRKVHKHIPDFPPQSHFSHNFPYLTFIFWVAQADTFSVIFDSSFFIPQSNPSANIAGLTLNHTQYLTISHCFHCYDLVQATAISPDLLWSLIRKIPAHPQDTGMTFISPSLLYLSPMHLPPF